jgi:hypothetical protein
MPSIEQFDERHDILIYTTVAEEYRIFAATQTDAAEIALSVCREKWSDQMVVKHEAVAMTAACLKCLDGSVHPWHDNGEYNE